MGRLFELILGLAIICYVLYVIVQVFFAATGTNGTSWGDISIHLIVVAIFVVLLTVGTWAEKKEKSAATPASSEGELTTTDDNNSPQWEDTYNPYTDKIQFDSIYLQDSKTWWNDSDGDYHEHGTDYAAVKFYEDGTMVAIRSLSIPNRQIPDSFSYQGTWQLNKNHLTFELEKTSDIDDSIEVYISPEESRNMKYAGHIADDDSLIKAGKYACIVKGGTLQIEIGGWLTHQSTLDLIITASEATCDALEQYFSQSPLLDSVFQNTGNWYSNGETGPEWFTVHLRTIEQNTDLVDAKLQQAMDELGLSVANIFWS